MKWVDPSGHTAQGAASSALLQGRQLLSVEHELGAGSVILVQAGEPHLHASTSGSGMETLYLTKAGYSILFSQSCKQASVDCQPLDPGPTRHEVALVGETQPGVRRPLRP
jgi:hypothetical protein